MTVVKTTVTLSATFRACTCLYSDEGNCTVEQRDDVQKAARDVLRDQDCAMVILRIALPLDVPILDGSNDMGLVCRAELKLNLIATFGVRIL